MDFTSMGWVSLAPNQASSICEDPQYPSVELVTLSKAPLLQPPVYLYTCPFVSQWWVFLSPFSINYFGGIILLSTEFYFLCRIK